MSGAVYLLHLDPGLPITGNRVARHYLGCAEQSVQRRLQEHLEGHGSPLVAVAAAHGNRVTIVRTWPGRGRTFERQLKRLHEAPRLYPVRVAASDTNGRGLLAPTPLEAAA